jgi:glycogen operon protein
MQNWTRVEGTCHPLGIGFIADEQAYNFAFYSKHAWAVTLLLFRADDPDTPAYSIPFDPGINKSTRVWHCRIAAGIVDDAAYYAYRVEGPDDPFAGHRFDSEKLLLDPYAQAVFFPPNHSRTSASLPGSNMGRAPLCLLHRHDETFDWENEVRPKHGHDAVIYEMHVRGFTQRENSGVAAERRGTFAGVVDKIPHLQDLGVTVVELLPVFQFDPAEHNYWGYMTLNFFAPHHLYAQGANPATAINEFKAMVKALHQAGMEVILDVVYNHTTEAGPNGPTYSYRGIDNSTYYLLKDDRRIYRNDAGTGNVLHTANRHVRSFIMDSLRYWVEEMHVDGFRFDLASIFTRRSDGSINIDDPPIISAIRSDPVLADVRLIAEAWDMGAYQLGRAFPGVTWQQWNGRFRDDVRRFVKSTPDLVNALIARLYGSNDLFPDDPFNAYHAYQSINFITAHDGFNMYDLVSYNQKHNLANGHNDSDGSNDNNSWNCGHEGDQGVPSEVLDLRKRQMRNLFTLLMLANGTPMFVAGDEFGHTQGGNNNPYNQDNETTWLDWDRLQANQELFRFCRIMIAFRKAHPSLGRSRFWQEDVSWFGVEGPPDRAYHSRSLALWLRGASQGDDDIYIMINAYWESLNFRIQADEASGWRRVVDTSLASPDDIASVGQEIAVNGSRYLVGPRSVVVLLRSA